MLFNNFTQQQYKSHHVIIPASQNSGALLLGDLNAATDQQIIKQFNIKTIITAACGLQHLKIPSQLTHVVFPLMDTKQQNIQTYFQLSFRTIQQNLKRGAVLVHCGAGISRSASLIIAYYMKKFNSSFKNAMGFVKRIKPNVCPNLGFQLQLKNYQNKLNIDKQKIQSVSSNRIKQQNKGKPVSSQYIFQIPLKNQDHKTFRNGSKVMNRAFNKTHGAKMHTNRMENNLNNQLFIEGKKPIQKNQFQKNLSLYQPQKYSRKHAGQQMVRISSSKKEKQECSINSFKF